MTILVCPRRLCVYSDEDRPATLNFLNMIDVVVLKRDSELTIDLSKVEYASASATVLLFAIVNRAQLIAKVQSQIRFKFPKKEDNLEGHKWIVQTGLSAALVANTQKKLEMLTKEKRYYQSAVEPFEHWLNTVSTIQETALLNADAFSLMSSALNEAILNVSYHAYEHHSFKSQLESLGGKRWWQCSWYNKEENLVVFIICDLGLGIHNSFATVFDNLPVSEISSVSLALSSGHSRHLNAGRGNGSEDIKRPIGSGCAESESLLVLTGHARYRYNSTDGKPRCEWLSENIPGTLIEWALVPRRGEDD
ncbi:hypothetical protein RJ492_000506 [Pluralibacter gergoviae]|uniref:STAS domain-containing protein n=1 Tax=Pluralibacter gergoviae TaxID=61647 RepID=A0AAI9GLH7_PLUGE|nr:hypothetical protein [Pluralibacter gergoviae]AVR03728.1 hypothetical protein A8H26_14040 [Pluralibacter gergoviae]EKT9641759.1 hypothetical protein [Pluralibacter gergoviae]EKV0913265.1 hypothetical protein [Pluralibacter gergoviae]EKV3545274.1 hypothetical protein [Pluralibacter gergoviae]EKV9898200.1 hypothetical protein [Pluralibacter gergoviae]